MIRPKEVEHFARTASRSCASDSVGSRSEMRLASSARVSCSLSIRSARNAPRSPLPRLSGRSEFASRPNSQLPGLVAQWRTRGVAHLVAYLNAEPTAVASRYLVSEPIEALVAFPAAHQFGASNAGLQHRTDDPTVDSERLVDAVEPEDGGALQIRRCGQPLRPSDDATRLLTARYALREPVDIEPAHERLDNQPLEADRRRGDTVRRLLISQWLAGQRPDGRGCHEPHPAHPSTQPRDQEISQPVRDRGETHRIDASLTRSRRIEGRHRRK